MKKLGLNIDDLAVESFQTTTAAEARGTVVGHGVSETTCFQRICDCPSGSGWTCEPSQNGTCEFTCDASCNGTCEDTCADGCTWCPVTAAPEYCLSEAC